MKTKSLLLLIILVGLVGIVWAGLSGCTVTSTTAGNGVNDPSNSPSSNDLSAAAYVGSLTCKTCHGSDEADGAYMQWKNSAHGATLLPPFTGSAASINCALCHATGYKGTGGYTSGSTEAVKFGVQCEECHGPGSLHSTSPSPTNINKVPSAETTCGKCHRGRTFVVKIGSKYDSPIDLNNKTTVNATIEAALPNSGSQEAVSSRHPIHYRPNMAVFKGTGGYEYSGSTYTNSYHTTGISNACVVCHLQYGADKHATEPDLAACQVCHTGATTFDIDGKNTEILTLLSTLGGKVNSYKAVFTTASSRTHESYTRALWNYYLISRETDAGAACSGAHNYRYAKQLLQDAIDNFDPNNP